MPPFLSLLARHYPVLIAVFALGVPAAGWSVRPTPAASVQLPITIGDATLAESGTTGTDLIRFPVQVNRTTTDANGNMTTNTAMVTVNYQGQSGTATLADFCGPGVDVALQASALTITGAVTTEYVNVILCDDALDETDAETFTVTLTSANGGSIQDSTATGTVLDNEPTPSLRVNDVAAPEGAAGEQRQLTFSINLSAASGRPVSVNYATAGAGGAVGGAACGGAVDFVTRTGQETFAAGTTSRSVPVTVCGDGSFESGETITLTLSAPANATIQDGTAVGTITNDDAQPMVSVTVPSGTVTEGNAGQQTVTVQVALSNANHGGASVTFTWGGTAQRGTACNGAVDIVTSGPQATVTWPANNNDARSVSFDVCGDARDDADDTVVLAGAASAAGLAPGSQNQTIVIVDDDPSPTVSVGDAAATEGEPVEVAVSLSAVSNLDVTVVLTAEAISTPPDRSIQPKLLQLGRSVAMATMGSSCVGAADFVGSSHNYTIPAGQTSGSPARFRICANTDLGSLAPRQGLSAASPVEVFQVRASGQNNATIAKGFGLVVIREP